MGGRKANLEEAKEISLNHAESQHNIARKGNAGLLPPTQELAPRSVLPTHGSGDR